MSFATNGTSEPFRAGQDDQTEINIFSSLPNLGNSIPQKWIRIPSASETNTPSRSPTPRSFTGSTSISLNSPDDDDDKQPHGQVGAGLRSSSPASESATRNDAQSVTTSEPQSASPRTYSPAVCPASTSLSVDIPQCVLLTPRSCFEGFEPPEGASLMSECAAVSLLSTALPKVRKPLPEDFVEFQLDEFVIYNNKDPEEMRSLNHMDTKVGHGKLFFDGILRAGDSKAYLRRVPIHAVPIGNYGSLNVHTVKGNVWLQSQLNSQKEIYYNLGKPAMEYVRFFTPFLWVADLAKHFVDYLKVMRESNRKVSIYHFRNMFGAWISKTHRKAPEFLKWSAQHPSEDYRTSIVANIGFLHKEAIGVLGHRNTYFHTIWAEAWEFTSIPNRPKAQHPRTVVTQYIFDCFKHLPFGDQLEAIQLSSKTEALRNRLIRQRHLELPSALHSSSKDMSLALKERIRNIKPGDTISTHRDDEFSGTAWRREISNGCSDVDRWFALVQSVRTNRNGLREFDVIWYYRPVDTLCGLMKYPWNNELFLSNHCSCSEKSKIDENEILGVHSVDFGGTSTTPSELFCRHTYLNEERRWITLQLDHLKCPHVSSSRKSQRYAKYLPGDTYLVHITTGSKQSEPCEFVTSFREERRCVYQFRRLLRRKVVDPSAVNARPNELVYSEHLVQVRKEQILGPCLVRFFRENEEISTPYNRDGVGGCFYITHREDPHNGVIPLRNIPTSLNQGYDPIEAIPKLRGVDLFCGGGNFGRGLEDGGGIQMRWANDYDRKAIHTYMANLQSPDDVCPFLGSIDDLQRLAIQGKFAGNVPPIGEVDFVSGGSPCPGFSRLTNDKTTIQQRKNQSMVAAFASFIDLYRPKYGLLENVPGIVHNKADRDQDVFSQLICAIVGLGYQTQFFFLDASSCGSSQRRSRIFLIFAAPGYELPQKPTQTHSHPPNTNNCRIGWLPNGQPMASREFPSATPFQFVSAREATAGLPSIFDGKPDVCILYPDHRIALGLTRQGRSRISSIPRLPWGSNFAQAWYGEDKKAAGSGVMTLSEREFYPGAHIPMDVVGQALSTSPMSNAYGRLYPDRLMETIVTTQNPGDAKNGRQLHWNEDRVLTVMEARRAQGFRDEDVLLGDASTQYKIVGNSVAREVAVALGVVIRQAWVKTLEKEKYEAMVSDTSSCWPNSIDHHQSRHASVTTAGVETTVQVSPTASTATAMVEETFIESSETCRSPKRPSTALVIELPSSRKRQRTNGDVSFIQHTTHQIVTTGGL